MNKYIVILLLFLSSVIFADQKRILSFTPLPMKDQEKTIEEFLPLINYLESELGNTITYNYKRDYKDILEGFENQNIDIAYLGPLPFAILKSQYPHVKPIISLRQKNGKVYYRCVISKFADDDIPKERPLKVALTQPLSTCGYYMTQKLVHEHLEKELASQHYHYTMSHTNALTEVLKGHYDIAGASEEIGEKFTSLGMQILTKSTKLPGFALVVNTETLSSTEIEAIKRAILNIPQEVYSRWGSKLRYGFESTDTTLYESIDIDQKIPKKGNMP
ncbi:MAG: PhnD/SsuA/transferrin family substrate-binding protein [Campylobacterota bacterium]|nr:PhnD/SsuA/transferrin family substrate-binding protein [Campylobacterota bacterium]